MTHKSYEKGQALIIVAFAAVALFAFAALAIDGSSVYSKKREAQNAADAAALSAALAKTRGNDWSAQAFASTLLNSFDNDGSSNTVDVYLCSDANASCTGLPTGADPSEYIQVIITANVRTYFTQIFERDHTMTAVEAIARSVPGYVDEIAFGNAVVALNQTDCKVFWEHGNADLTTVGGGIFVNSTANCGFTINGNPDLDTPSISIVGETSSPVVAGGNYGVSQLPYPPIELPNPSCGSTNAVKSGSNMSPGNWSGSFPPNGVTHLSGGIYCINGDFRLNGNDTLTGTEVLIVMESGDISWNGSGELHLSAPTDGPFEGLLIYVPMTNPNTITINGTNDQELTGTILAPASDIVLLGTAGTNGFNSQIIGYNVEVGGTFNGTINYDDLKNYNALIPPTVELTK